MRIKAKFIDKKNKDNLNLLFFDFKGEIIKALILEMNIDIKIGDFVNLYIKPTLLCLSDKKIDFENVLEVDIKEIILGEIIAKIICVLGDYEFEVLMLKENVNFEKKAYLYFKSNFVVVEK